MKTFTKMSIRFAGVCQISCILVDLYETRFPLIQDRIKDDVSQYQFTETMHISMIVLTWLIVFVSNQIDRSFRTTTIGERLKTNTIIEFNVQTILGIIERDLTFDKEQIQKENNDSHLLDHLLFEKRLPMRWDRQDSVNDGSKEKQRWLFNAHAVGTWHRDVYIRDTSIKCDHFDIHPIVSKVSE